MIVAHIGPVHIALARTFALRVSRGITYSVWAVIGPVHVMIERRWHS